METAKVEKGPVNFTSQSDITKTGAQKVDVASPFLIVAGKQHFSIIDPPVGENLHTFSLDGEVSTGLTQFVTEQNDPKLSCTYLPSSNKLLLVDSKVGQLKLLAPTSSQIFQPFLEIKRAPGKDNEKTQNPRVFLNISYPEVRIASKLKRLDQAFA